MKKLLLFCLFVFPLINKSFAFTGQKSTNGYIENKGQIVDQSGNKNSDVRFLLNRPGMNVQLRSSGFSYDCYHVISFGRNLPDVNSLTKSGKGRFASKDSSIVYYNRIDVSFVNANQSPELVYSNPSKDYTNYYTNGSGNGILKVHSYSDVMYKNIYPQIDLEFYLNSEGNCKYQFIIHPGGNPNDIVLQYNGADRTYISNNQLILKFGSDSIVEKIPVSYILENGRKVSVSFKELKTNSSGFDITQPDNTGTLVIDPNPNFQWSTYYGGAGVDQIWGVTAKGNAVYGVGQTMSISNIATAGSYQSTLVQTEDGFICKFDVNGNRIWGTYYGGSANDGCFSITTDDQNHLYVVGYTYATVGISTPGAYQPSSGGDADGMILKFDTAGVRIWGTYYGGTGFDILGSIICRGSFLYFTGEAESPSAFASPGCHQPIYGGGEDGILAKFTTSGTRVWSTYYGEGGDDNGVGIDCDGNNLFLTGWTYSTLQIATPGAYQTAIAGSSGFADAFLAKFDTNGVRQWGTYFGGSNMESGESVVAFGGAAYITGETDSYTNIATVGAYQTTNTIGGAFIAKFSYSGQRIWGTFYGGNSQDFGSQICQAFGDLFIAGYTKSNNAMASPNAYQQSIGGDWDAFIARFDTTGNRVWGTYLGGPDVEEANAFFVDNSHIVIGGLTGSTSGLATNNGFQNVFGGGTLDGWIASDFDLCQSFSLIVTSMPDNGSSNGSATVEVVGGTSPYSYLWNNNDTTMQSSNLNSGWYVVTVTDSNQCQITDSVFVNSTMGVLNSNQDYSFEIFPNPASSEITISLSSTFSNTAIGYVITDMLGNTVQTGHLNSFSNKINVSGLATGYYTVNLTVGGNFTSRPRTFSRM